MAEQLNPTLQNPIPAVSVKEVNPLDLQNKQSTEQSRIIKNIVSNETADKEESILGEAPLLDSSLLEDFEPRKSLLLAGIKIFFSMAFFASVASLLFFNSQLNPKFDYINTKLGIPSVIKDVSSTNTELINLKTEINTYTFLLTKSFLDRFSFDGDIFARNFEIARSQTASESEKAEAKEKLIELKQDIGFYFNFTKTLIAKDIFVPIVDKEYSDDANLHLLFQDKIMSTLKNKSDSLSKDQSPETRKDYKNYLGAATIVGNSKLKDLLIKTDFDTLGDAETYNLIKEIDAIIVNDMSTIQKIKNTRIKWSDIINEIELRTKAIDAHYSKDYYDTVGGVRYTSFDFDSDNRSIGINGETKTIDTATFTMIADLIDELNRSKFFKNGETRSFSKSGSLENGYSGSIKLNLDLENDLIVTGESSDLTNN